MAFRVGIAIIVAAGVVCSVLLLDAPPAAPPPVARPAPAPTAEPVRVRAATVVERTYLGVACRRPNSIRCDRVGLAVWLKRPAERVAARLAGRRISLEDAEVGRPPRMFAGYLRPAGLADGPLRVPFSAGGRWTGEGAVSARVRLWIEARGRTAVTTVRTRLRAGWG